MPSASYLSRTPLGILPVPGDPTVYFVWGPNGPGGGVVRGSKASASLDRAALVYDWLRGEIRASGTAQIIVTPPPAPSARTLYVEPADPWTAYPWVDGELLVNDAWVLANSVLEGDERVVRGLSRRNMVTGQCAVKVSTQYKVRFEQCQFMGVGADGTAVGIVGIHGRVRLVDCSLYGPPMAQLANGQFAGWIAPKYFTSVEVSNCNFRSCGGVHAAEIGAPGNSTDGLIVVANDYYNIDGRYRDSTTSTGYREGHKRDVDVRFTNAMQLAGGPAGASIYVYAAWNRVRNIQGQSFVEDTFNTYGVSCSPTRRGVIEHNFLEGAYPVLPGLSYSGGGVLVGDEGGNHWTIQKNVVLNTSNYGCGIAGGDDNHIIDNYVMGINLTPDGRPVEDNTDAGIYIRNYPSNPRDLSKVYAARNTVSWMKPQWGAGKKWNFSVEADKGTVYDNIEPAGDVTEAQLQAGRDLWESRRAAAGIVVGRRNPA